MNFSRKVQEIEELRYLDPQKSLEKAESLARNATGDEILAAIGEWGSSLKATGHLEEAREVLTCAIDHLSDLRATRERKSDFLRRLSWVELSSGNPNLAGGLAQDALLLATSIHHEKIVGRSYAAMAAAHHHVGQYREAIDCARSALCYLETEYDRFGVLVNLSQHHQSMGNSSACELSLAQALSLDVPEGLKNRTEWVAAKADLESGRLTTAARRFKGTAESFLMRGEIVEAALACSLEVEALRLKGELREAKLRAQRMARLVFLLRKEKLAAAAVLDLVRKSMDIDWAVDACTLASVRERLQSAIDEKLASYGN